MDGPQGRRIYTLAMMFLRSGYDVTLVLRLRFSGNIHRKLKRLLLQEPVSYVRHLSEVPGEYLLISDTPPSTLPKGCRKLVVVDYDAYTVASESLPLPFPMHPYVYREGLDLRLQEYRKQPRKIRMFFMGDIDPKYSSHRVENAFNKVPRDRMVALLQKEMPEGSVLRVRTLDEWRNVSQEGFSGLVLASTRDFQIPFGEWLQAMATTDIFLGCPGVNYPMCHNAVEALAVGTIPFLEYSCHFHPHLRDNEDCFVFSGEKGLLRRAGYLLGADGALLETMRQKAAAYYDSVLAPGVLTQKIEACPKSVCHLKALAHKSEVSAVDCLQKMSTVGKSLQAV